MTRGFGVGGELWGNNTFWSLKNDGWQGFWVARSAMTN